MAVCCLISLNLARQAFFPASLFWAFGALTIGVTAVLGGFKYAGYDSVETYHTTAKYFATSVGITAFALGAVSGLFANFFIRFHWWILLALIVILSALLLVGHWRLSPDIQKIVVGVIFLVGLVRLISAGMLAVYLIFGVACFVMADMAVGWLAVNTGLDKTNIFHVLLSLGVVSFGLSASRDNWE